MVLRGVLVYILCHLHLHGAVMSLGGKFPSIHYLFDVRNFILSWILSSHLERNAAKPNLTVSACLFLVRFDSLSLFFNREPIIIHSTLPHVFLGGTKSTANIVTQLLKPSLHPACWSSCALHRSGMFINLHKS